VNWSVENIHVWHLQRLHPLDEQAASKPYELSYLANPDPNFCRFLYATVGAPWRWYEKLAWSLEEWRHHVSQKDTHFWVAFHQGNPIGYFEIRQENHSSAEICLFGLMPDWIGKGLGKPFLQDAIRLGFELVTDRVWLHTCSMDHPNALKNYQSQGFEIFKEETFDARVPTAPLEPFVGAFSETLTD